MEHALRFVDLVGSKHGKMHMMLAGGEPTLWRELETFLSKVKESHDVTIKVISNGFKRADYWKRLSPLLDSVIFSLHVGQIRDIDRFIDSFNAVEIPHKSILILAWPDHWQLIRDYHLKLVDRVIQGTIQMKPVDNRFSKGKDLVSYSNDQKEFMRTNSLIRKGIKTSNYAPSYLSDGVNEREINSSILIDELNRFKGWSCNIGLEKLSVMENGDIYRGSCSMGGKIGNLRDPELTLPTDPIICQNDLCNCTPDIMVSKNR